MKHINLRQVISAAVITALSAALLTGCGKAASANGTEGENAKSGENNEGLRTLRVAVMTGQPDHYAAFIGLEEGIFEKYGIDLQTTEYAKGINTIDAIANGTADTGQCADFAGVNRIGNTLEYNDLVFYAEQYTSHAKIGGVYVAPQYADDLSKLKGSEGWITSIGTASEYSNWKAQTAIGLDPDEEKFVNTDSNQTALAAATNGEASAVVATGTLSQKYEEIGWVKVATAEDIDSKVGSYLVTTNAFVDENSDLLADYIKAFDEAVNYINDNLDESAERISAKFGVEAEDFKTDWLTPDIILGFTEEGAAHLESIANWAESHGKFENDYNVRDYIRLEAVEKAFPDRVTVVK